MTAVSEPTTDSSDSTTSSQHDALARDGYVILEYMHDPEQLARVRIQPSALRTLGAPTGKLLPVRPARSRDRNVTSPEVFTRRLDPPTLHRSGGRANTRSRHSKRTTGTLLAPTTRRLHGAKNSSQTSRHAGPTAPTVVLLNQTLRLP